MTVPAYAAGCVLAVAGWLALYRLPFADPARRRRTALWLADRTGLRPDPAFAVFATSLYLGLAAAVLAVLLPLTDLSLDQVVGRPSTALLFGLPLAVLGTSSLNILCVSLLYRAAPRVDVPGEIARIRWIASILTLPRRYRWIVPATAALFEELVFRGAVLLGLGSLHSGFAFAAVFSTLLFAAGQVVLVSTPVQAYVMATSSIALGTVGSLLIAATGSILPALVLHMSFAGFYTTMSATARPQGANTRRPSL
ncbi:type II CAAX prenyl endopeptidase Rce1 family protein [Kitasatospora sp. NPDC059327]|uniref:CPBP family glutamic-type intramembrane protease n=1 Tax=Kitasatospora sp. NPDC059327 TaxID=3346803 RepID=UPI0036B75E24